MLMQDLVQTGTVQQVREALAKEPTTQVLQVLPMCGSTLLHAAAGRETQAAEVCSLLLRARACASKVNLYGHTALQCAVKQGNVSCAEVLIEGGCDVNDTNNTSRVSPFMQAAVQGSVELIRRLLQLRADVAPADQSEPYPIFYTSRHGACLELFAWCSLARAAEPAEHLVKTYVATHAKQRNSLANLFAVGYEAWTLGSNSSWALREETSDVFSGFATLRAEARDVQELCNLEDEFITDHRKIIVGKIQESVFFEQIGLKNSAAARRKIIKTLAMGLPQKGPVRHYTVVCRYVPPVKHTTKPKGGAGGGSGLTEQRSKKGPQTVGYIYFKLCDGLRDGHGGVRQEPLTPSGGKVGNLVISHIKVSKSHTQQGVAHLLLAAALRLTADMEPGFVCRQMYLSVLKANVPALNLYKKLGFHRSNQQADGWVNMERPMNTPPSRLASDLMRVPWSRGTGAIAGASAARVSAEELRVGAASPRATDNALGPPAAGQSRITAASPRAADGPPTARQSRIAAASPRAADGPPAAGQSRTSVASPRAAAGQTRAAFSTPGSGNPRIADIAREELPLAKRRRSAQDLETISEVSTSAGSSASTALSSSPTPSRGQAGAADAKQENSLPDGWAQFTSRTTGKVHYFHGPSGRTQMHLPS